MIGSVTGHNAGKLQTAARLALGCAALACVFSAPAAGDAPLTPTNVVASQYHSPLDPTNPVAPPYPHLSRERAFLAATDGVIDNGASGRVSEFNTFEHDSSGGITDFVGLIYGQMLRFDTIVVHLGKQFGDGGSWQSQPSLYLLDTDADPNESAPESDARWVLVPAALTTTNTFEQQADYIKNGNDPAGGPALEFDLTGLDLAQRAGYGWAVGGVDGDGDYNFLSVTELQGFGGAVPEPTALTLAGLGAAVLVTRRR